MSVHAPSLLSALMLALCAVPASAEEAISTAAAGAPPAAAAQIDRWIAVAPEPVDGSSIDQRRRIHGEVGVAVGTGGYLSGYLVGVMPLGETGSLTLAISQTRNGRGHNYDPGLDLDPIGPRPPLSPLD
ncbi:hypothetical protein M9M90_11515 [Phenylobacterium sp. LH3H17]|uniref:hypothetical protein n=1 Tax=Phenylobacterium sp. LH3H17 TaxID=2903901 RepID=UPI0020CA137E|nr:hypothetical protein [Phenylobacterium sp. LH3H17]UTP37868.1 hypothetical protein M9M90_11515 [Phenylobacterium sp. LH3H17]